MSRELLPWSREVKLSELLGHLDRFTHHSLHFVIVSHLGEGGGEKGRGRERGGERGRGGGERVGERKGEREGGGPRGERHVQLMVRGYFRDIVTGRNSKR